MIAFDKYAFDAPDGSAVTRAPDAVTLVKGSCSIGLHRSRRSVGNASGDLEAAWRALVSGRFELKGKMVFRDFPLPQSPTAQMRRGTLRDGTAIAVYALRFAGYVVPILVLGDCGEELIVSVRWRPE